MISNRKRPKSGVPPSQKLEAQGPPVPGEFYQEEGEVHVTIRTERDGVDEFDPFFLDR